MLPCCCGDYFTEYKEGKTTKDDIIICELCGRPLWTPTWWDRFWHYAPLRLFGWLNKYLEE